MSEVLFKNIDKNLVEELREYLSQLFHIAVRVREIKEGRGYRLYQQVQKSGNRHLIDVRQVRDLSLAQRIEQVLVMAPAELIDSKSDIILSTTG